MKRTIFIAVAAALFGLGAYGAYVAAEDHRQPKPEPGFPVTGMKASDLRKALSGIEKLLPAEPGMDQILSVTVQDAEHIEVRTGMVAGPLAGRGKLLKFRKAGKKWTKESEGDWVS